MKITRYCEEIAPCRLSMVVEKTQREEGLVESSWILIYRDPVMKYKYERLKIRKGAKRAIIAIAENLIIRIRKIVLNNEPYHKGITRRSA